MTQSGNYDMVNSEAQCCHKRYFRIADNSSVPTFSELEGAQINSGGRSKSLAQSK